MSKSNSVSIRLLAVLISEALIEGLSLDEMRKLHAIINLINHNIQLAISLYIDIPLLPIAKDGKGTDKKV